MQIDQEEERLKAARSIRGDISSFIAMDVLARANLMERDGKRVVHMEVGQPSTPAPQCVLEAAKTALSENKLGYTEAVGILPLRERIAAYYQENYGVKVGAERIVVTTGSSAGFILAFLAILDVGGRVALASPGYPCYRHILTSLGNQAVMITTDETSRWAPRVEDVLKLHSDRRLDALLIASPANPTGTMLTPERLEGLVVASEEKGIWFISDEIYHGLTYEDAGRTALEFSDNTIIINSFSKYFSMTGWRIGWMVLPEPLVRVVERLQQNLFISAPTLSQYAAISAFDGLDEAERNRASYRKNRDTLLEGLQAAGISKIAPADGAFYLYADISDFSSDSLSFANKMLEEIHVAATPGLDFDEERGRQFLRFSYAGSHSDVVEASERICVWLARR